MIPLRDVIPSRTTPYITVTIIILNALAWFYELALPRDVLPLFLQFYGVVPADFTAMTLVSSMFLHGSWSHVIGNMWYLWIFGDNVEEIFELPAIVLLGFWFLIQLFSAGAIAVTANASGRGGVAFVAHVAGFIFGMIAVFVFKKRQRQPEWI